MSSTPRARGYQMPPEWAPHEATWMTWPHREGISFPDAYEKVVPALTEMVRVLAQSEKVHLNVDAARQKEIKTYLRGIPETQIRFFDIPNNEPWCRDHGPIFLTAPNLPRLILDWGYNAWGGKYPPFDRDDVIPTKIAEQLGLEVVSPGIILEGGSIEVNGAGTLLTTESCLLNPNRNPTLSREEIERYLIDYLGVRQVLWLGDGIEGDDTDGHIDDLTRFVSEDTVVTVVEKDPSDTNYEPLQENLKRLRTLKLWDGRPLKVVELPMPNRIDREDLRLPASYGNFYIANQSVLLPVFNDPNDSKAIEILKPLFSNRKIVPIDCTEVIWGLGAIHCLTQQQPK